MQYLHLHPCEIDVMHAGTTTRHAHATGQSVWFFFCLFDIVTNKINEHLMLLYIMTAIDLIDRYMCSQTFVLLSVRVCERIAYLWIVFGIQYGVWIFGYRAPLHIGMYTIEIEPISSIMRRYTYTRKTYMLLVGRRKPPAGSSFRTI